MPQAFPTTIQKVHLSLAGNQLGDLNSNPVAVVPGVGDKFAPVAMRVTWQPGAAAFADVSNVVVTFRSSVGDANILSQPVNFNDAPDAGLSYGVNSFVSEILYGSEGQDVVLATDTDLGIIGPIFTVSINDGGASYEVDDVVAISGGDGTGRARVTAEDAGVATALVLTVPGQGYSTATAVDTTGGGTGLKVDITVVEAATGTLTVDLYYLLAG